MNRYSRLLALTVFLIFYFVFQVCSQVSPKREFRGVWVATVMNIDWPSKQGLNSRQQMREIDIILDHFKAMNLNAVILQVRPLSDAFYRSGFEPWSHYLSGIQGAAPNPFYDPLDYFIEGCHSRGMELHAWLNPFRVKQNVNDKLINGHFFIRNPEWGWVYGSKTYLDPGVPAVREYVTEVVKDIVKRYDIDAIHFDDYFYPYPLNGKKIPDDKTFELYNNGYSQKEKDDWRRNNVDTFIYNINREIKSIKPWVRFGVSPFGVWRNQSNDPMGSNTDAGVTTYDVLYADVLKWARQGWVDYLVPQIYWQFGHPKADFSTLADWWNNHSYGRHVYIGHGLYRLNEVNGDPSWKNPIELPRQIQLVRQKKYLTGSVWFSSNHFFKERIGFSDLLQNSYYKHKALIPPSVWIDNIPPQPPVNLKASRVKDNNVLISWDKPFVKGSFEEPKFYVVYRYERDEKFVANDPKFIFDVVKHNEYLIKIPFLKFKKEHYFYRVSVLDRLNNESVLSNPILINQ